MCILIVSPPGTSPDLSDLWEATDQNPDGHGWAIRTRGTIERYVTMDADRALSTFLDARDRWPNNWALWHSRFATQGNLDTSNCQPIPVPGTGWVMGHNGILPLSDGPFDDTRSDSRILAEDHITQVTWAAMRNRFDELDSWISPSKVVVMSPHKERGGPVIIFGENRGTWSKDGCWWSTRPHVWPTRSVGTRAWDTAWSDTEATATWDEEADDRDLYDRALRELEKGDLITEEEE